MSDYTYSAELVDRVAAAIALGVDDTYLFTDDPRYPGKRLGAPHSVDYVEEMRDGARAALEALGLREEWAAFVVDSPATPELPVSVEEVVYQGYSESAAREVGEYVTRRYVTDPEEVK